MSDVPVPVEETKPYELTETPAVHVVEETPKTETTPAVTETAAVVEETVATETKVIEETKKEEEEVKAASTQKRPKSPNLLSKLLAPFKNEKKVKAPKSPTKKEKEKDKKKEEEEAETPVTEEAPKPEETPAAAVDTAADLPKDVSEQPKDIETSAAETPAADAPKEEKYKGHKFTRRLSARVGDLFRKTRSEVPTTARVDELPPKIDEPTPVAPLENPASKAVAAETSAEPSEPIKPIEPVPTATPIVAAAA